MDKYKTLNMNYISDCDAAIKMAKKGIFSAIIGNVDADNWEKYFSDYSVYGPTGDCIYEVNPGDKIGFIIPPYEIEPKKVVKTDYYCDDYMTDGVYTTDDGMVYQLSDFVNEYYKIGKNKK